MESEHGGVKIKRIIFLLLVSLAGCGAIAPSMALAPHRPVTVVLECIPHTEDTSFLTYMWYAGTVSHWDSPYELHSLAFCKGA